MTNPVPIDIEAARNEIESCGSLNEDIAADALDELEAARKEVERLKDALVRCLFQLNNERPCKAKLIVEAVLSPEATK